MAIALDRIQLGTYKGRTVYQKGIKIVALFDADGNSLVASGTTSSANLNITVDAGELRGGLSNVVLITVPTNANMTFDVTFQDTNFMYSQITTGSTIRYGGAVPQPLELILSPEKTFTLEPKYKPVIELGAIYRNPIARVDGNAMEIVNNIISYPQGIVGNKYCVTFYVDDPFTQILPISTNIVGRIVRAVIMTPLYSKPQAGSVDQNTLIGWRLYHIPSAQANGNDATPLGQDTFNTKQITFTALPFDEFTSKDPCASSSSYFAYYQDYIPADGHYNNAKGILVEGGGITVDAGESETIPLMMQMNSGLVAPVTAVEDFEFETNEPSATINIAGGIATYTAGSLSGTYELTITGKTQPDTTNIDLSRLTTTAIVTVI